MIFMSLMPDPFQRHHMPRRSGSPIEFLSESEHSDDDWDPPDFDLNDSDLVWPFPSLTFLNIYFVVVATDSK